MLGFTEEHRLKADYQFYEAMLVDAAKAPWWRRWWYKMWAWAYYRAVVRLGGVRQIGSAEPPFNYSDAEMTLEDLMEKLSK